MFDKLNFTEIIRYFFSGLIAAGAILIGCGVTPRQTIEWAKQNAWAADFSPSIAAAALVLLLGYVCFTIYRAVLYDQAIVRIHAWLATKCFRFHSPKTLIKTILLEQNPPCNIGPVEVERVYRVVRQKIAKEFYEQAASRISAGIHLLYLLTILCGVAFAWARSSWWLIPFTVAFIVVLLIDAHYMREELIMFVRGRDTLEDELRKLTKDPLWRSAQSCK